MCFCHPIPDEFRSKVACENDTIQLVCNPYSRIAVYSASFGRTSYESIQCSQPQGVMEECKCYNFCYRKVGSGGVPVHCSSNKMFWVFLPSSSLLLQQWIWKTLTKWIIRTSKEVNWKCCGRNVWKVGILNLENCGNNSVHLMASKWLPFQP